jgi:hypothetical protein
MEKGRPGRATLLRHFGLLVITYYMTSTKISIEQIFLSVNYKMVWIWWEKGYLADGIYAEDAEGDGSGQGNTPGEAAQRQGDK